MPDPDLTPLRTGDLPTKLRWIADHAEWLEAYLPDVHAIGDFAAAVERLLRGGGGE